MSVVVFSHTKGQEKRYCAELLKEKPWFERVNFSVFLPKNENETGKIFKKDEIIWLKNGWEEIERVYFNAAKNLGKNLVIFIFESMSPYPLGCTTKA